MNNSVDNLPFVALIDDDKHSAHLLTRMLLANGAPEIRWYGGASEGGAKLATVLANPATSWPDLLIVDLKAHSQANIEFIAAIQSLARQRSVPVLAMVAPLDRPGRDALHDAGAASVFFRHADIAAYRRETAGIVSFWARTQRLDAVGM